MGSGNLWGCPVHPKALAVSAAVFIAKGRDHSVVNNVMQQKGSFSTPARSRLSHDRCHINFSPPSKIRPCDAAFCQNYLTTCLPCSQRRESIWTRHLVAVEVVFGLQVVDLVRVERDDNQRHEDVEEEERKDDEVDDVEDGRVPVRSRLRTSLLHRGIHRHPQQPVTSRHPPNWI